MVFNDTSLWVCAGLTPALLSASIYFADVPNTVICSASAKSNRTVSCGYVGAPSYNSKVAPVVKQPVAGLQIGMKLMLLEMLKQCTARAVDYALGYASRSGRIKNE